jgi:hypothetical protein
MFINIQAAEKYPLLSRYRYDWATDDFIRCKIKISKAIINKQSLVFELAESRLKNALKKSAKSSKPRSGV